MLWVTITIVNPRFSSWIRSSIRDVEIGSSADFFGSPEAFRRIPLFAGLNQEALQALSKLSHYQSFAAGEMIMGQQDQSFDVLFLVSGHARVNIYSATGKRVSFREIREGAISANFRRWMGVRARQALRPWRHILATGDFTRRHS